MRVLYVSNIYGVHSKGYAAKISGQIQSLLKNGIDVSICEWNNSYEISNNLDSPFNWRIILLKRVLKIQRSTGVKQIYFRYSPLDLFFIYVIFILKVFRKCDIVLEVPTYPYYKHILKSKSKQKAYIQLFMDLVSRPFLALLVSRVTLISNERDKLSGVPVLKIRNGVDINAYPMKQYTDYSTGANQLIELLFVGNESFYHGLDLVLKGLRFYKEKGYQNDQKVHFTIVGTVLQHTKDMIVTSDIEDMVSIETPKYGHQLDIFFDHATICIGTLASKRLSRFHWSPLKHREYCSRGMPFVFDGNDPDFKAVDFVFKVNEEDKFLNISELVVFVNKLKRVYTKNFASTIRQFAEQNLGWDKAQEELIKYYQRRFLEY